MALEEISRRWIKKFQAHELAYKAVINFQKLPEHLRQEPSLLLPDFVRALFSELIRQSTENSRSTDLIRFFINAPDLDRPISTFQMPVSTLTVEKIM